MKQYQVMKPVNDDEGHSMFLTGEIISVEPAEDKPDTRVIATRSNGDQVRLVKDAFNAMVAKGSFQKL